MDRIENLASDVLEGWTPETPDVHPDDAERSYDDDGAPILRCPMVPASYGNATMDGAIEGAGGTWWRPKSSAWSVEPSRIRALSPRGRAWLKATHARIAHYTTPGETDQKTGPLYTACRAVPAVPPPTMTCKARRLPDATETHHAAVKAWDAARKAWRDRVRFLGIDSAGSVVLSLTCDETHARAIVEAYGVAGRPLTLRPA